ncbi:hypothetical protein HanPSC8_Chr15g0648891 [Helianthus annuus]|nr:hypothetical protein HanPSC8_Chr15g0648891 [Helianthus annuus]
MNNSSLKSNSFNKQALTFFLSSLSMSTCLNELLRNFFCNMLYKSSYLPKHYYDYVKFYDENNLIGYTISYHI